MFVCMVFDVVNEVMSSCVCVYVYGMGGNMGEIVSDMETISQRGHGKKTKMTCSQ